MNKLKRYENFENLKANNSSPDLKIPKKNERELRNLFAELRNFKVAKKSLPESNSNLNGG